MTEDWYDRDWAIADDALAVVLAAVRERRPERILELGAGRSTVAIAAELQSLGGGLLVSLEHDEASAEVVRARLATPGLDALASVVVAPLRPVEGPRGRLTWYDPPSGRLAGPIELLLVDGPPNPPVAGGEARYPALPLLGPLLADHALIVVDDAHRAGERAMVERWLREEPGWVARDVPAERGLVLLTRQLG